MGGRRREDGAASVIEISGKLESLGKGGNQNGGLVPVSAKRVWMRVVRLGQGGVKAKHTKCEVRTVE